MIDNKIILAALECIMKRQATIARMIVDTPNREKYVLELSEALDGYIEALNNARKEHENGRE